MTCRFDLPREVVVLGERGSERLSAERSQSGYATSTGGSRIASEYWVRHQRIENPHNAYVDEAGTAAD